MELWTTKRDIWDRRIFFLSISRRLLFQVSATGNLGANLVSWCVEYSATTLAFMSRHQYSYSALSSLTAVFLVSNC